MDIRIEAQYKQDELFNEDGVKVTEAVPYWVLYIDSEVKAMTSSSCYEEDFKGVIDAHREACSEEAD